MPDLEKSLRDHDLGHLQIVAEAWGVELRAPDPRTGRAQLVAALVDPELVAEVVAALPAAALSALTDLVGHGGRLPWPLFTRRYGGVRAMGPGRRDRERPDRQPASPAEVLWYRALVARAFFDTPAGPEEFAYIPADLLPLIPTTAGHPEGSLGRSARPEERARVQPASDRILDEAASLLAALRLDFSSAEIATLAERWHVPPAPLEALLSAAGLVGADGRPDPDASRAFLEAGRGAALALLAQAWRGSAQVNELRLIPHLQAEGEWENDPLRARQALLSFLESVPRDLWWNLPAFTRAIQQANPDFQRPAGDYDSWYLRDRRTGVYLRGFENWEAVDGEYIRYMITGPLHWLGLMDLAGPAGDSPPAAFRFSRLAADLLAGRAPAGLAEETDPLHVRSDGRLLVPPLAGRGVRYQIARFCLWEGEGGDGYHYRITPASLERARSQGLRVGHLLALLRRHAETVPPNLARALDRWETHGTEARAERVTVLRLASPELLAALRRSRAARFLGDPLGPTTVVVRPGAWEKVQAILTELGYLAEGPAKPPDQDP